MGLVFLNYFWILFYFFTTHTAAAAPPPPTDALEHPFAPSRIVSAPDTHFCKTNCHKPVIFTFRSTNHTHYMGFFLFTVQLRMHFLHTSVQLNCSCCFVCHVVSYHVYVACETGRTHNWKWLISRPMRGKRKAKIKKQTHPYIHVTCGI